METNKKHIIRFYSKGDCLSIIETDFKPSLIGELCDKYQKQFGEVNKRNINLLLVYLIENGVRFRELNNGGEISFILN